MKFIYNYKYLIIAFLIFIFSILLPSINLAENPKPILSNEIPILLTDREYFLSILLLLFGCFIILVETILLYRIIKLVGGSIESIFITLTTTLIIIGGLFIVTAGFGTEQIAPVFGLYGAIIGYLLGQHSQKENISKTKNQEKNDENQK